MTLANLGADAIQQGATRLRDGVLLALVDLLLVAVCFATVLMIRYDGSVPPDAWSSYLSFLPRAAAVYVAVHAVAGLYRRVWRYAGVEEARRILLGGTVAGLIVVLLAILDRDVPRSVAAGGAVFTTMMVGTTRFQARLFAFRRRVAAGGLRVVVLGAGDTGAMLIRQMKESHRLGLRPIAILDDDRSRHGRAIGGLRVAGRFTDLPEVARRYDAHQAVLAVPTADKELVQKVAGLADTAGVALRVLPKPGTVPDSPISLLDVRELSIEDLLGRSQVSTDLGAVSSLVAGRRVLVTGGGGSIGSEIVRQVARLHPAALVILDHDETHLHDAIATLGLAPGVEPTAALCDVRDPVALRAVMDRHRPEVLFHAAAHKHVPMLERHAVEAVRTNIFGTLNVVRAAERVGCQSLVLISTDKAVEPESLMGASKRIAEHIVISAAQQNGRPWCAVRFGNVLGSRGSVVPTFAAQISSGGPVTVTDPRMTRYFMSIPEAVALVIQAAALSEGADLFMLDMGDPVRIVELASRMIRLAGRRVGDDVELRFTGLRPGEKLHEQLSTPDEGEEATTHPSIRRLWPRPLGEAELTAALADLEGSCARMDDPAVAGQLRELARRRTARHALVPTPRGASTEDNGRSGLNGGESWNRSTT